jgi:hypothetical protein
MIKKVNEVVVASTYFKIQKRVAGSLSTKIEGELISKDEI